jgi:ferritin-like metal-binding protein YciE
MEASEQLTAWLRDAHAMESSLEQVLARHIAAAREHPELCAGLERHLDQTREQRESVARCLEILGTTPSGVKAMAGGFMGAMQGMSTGVFQDELIKNALADYAMEHFEIGCYSSLIAAAEDAGHDTIARICADIMREEVEMAGWLEDQIPQLTRLHLHPSAA